MPFNSFVFGLYFILVFLGYWSLTDRFRMPWLLIASGLFYFTYSPLSILVFLWVATLGYFSGIGMKKDLEHKKWWLWGGVLGMTLTLGVFKYLGFLGFEKADGLLELIVPVGISFYVFSFIGYLVDVYTGKIKPEKKFGKLLLFGGFFPKLVAGPIERYSSLMGQMNKKIKFGEEMVVAGLKLFALGLFKKIVVADNLGRVVDLGFLTLGEFKGLSLWIIMFLYGWQIYADFSGYTDMARGLAKMLGINLSINFKNPYLATSVRDFWRRWHISLSNWLKDYLYIPLGGSRVGIVRTLVNTMIVFLVCGLWHGASWQFVIWGFWHGLVLVMERLVGLIKPKTWRLPKFMMIGYTYAMVTISWVFFRSENLKDAWYILSNSLVGIKNIVNPNYVWATMSQIFETNRVEMAITGGVLAAMIVYELLSSKYDLNDWLNRQKVGVRWACYVGVTLMILMIRNAQITEYIYVRF